MNKYLIILLFLSSTSFAQSPTYQALVKMNYSTDNNKVSLNKEHLTDHFNDKRNTVWSNIYFKYFKNLNTTGLSAPDESMKFSVRYQILFDRYCSSDSAINVQFSKSVRDKVVDVDVSIAYQENGKVTTTRLKGKSISIEKNKENINVIVREGVIKPGSFVTILIDTESYNFKELKPTTIEPSVKRQVDYQLSLNVPEVFSYTMPESPQVAQSEMTLKQFTNSTPPITDYKVKNFSYRWTSDQNDIEKITFKLTGIVFGANVGTSYERIESSE